MSECRSSNVEHFSSYQKRIENLQRRFDLFEQNSSLNIEKNEIFLDQWEKETIESIRQRVNDVRQKLRDLFRLYQNENDEFKRNFKENLQKQTSVENDLSGLASKIGQVEREIQHGEKIFHEVTSNELHEIFSKLIRFVPTEWIQWTFLYEIPLKSTYGFLSANEQQILLGWKTRLDIFDSKGQQLDRIRLKSSKIHGNICDIIWSSHHQVFFILSEKSLFLYDVKIQQLLLLSQISIYDEDHRFISICHHRSYVIILNNRSIEVWNSNNRVFQFVESISFSKILDDVKTESICAFRSNGTFLTFLIQDERQRSFRFDLFIFFPLRRYSKGIEFDQFSEKNLAVFAYISPKICLFFNWENQSMRRIDFAKNLNHLVQCNVYNACRVVRQNHLILNAMTHLKVFQLQI